MNRFTIASAFLVACVALIGIASANLHKGGLKGHHHHQSCHSDDCYDGGHRHPFHQFNDDVLIDELRFRGFICLIRESHVPGRGGFGGYGGHIGGHGPVINKGKGGYGGHIGGGKIGGGFNHKEKSGGSFGGFQGSSSGSTFNSDASDRDFIVGQQTKLDLDNKKSNHNNLDVTNQHQVIDSEKVLFKDRTKGTNDVQNLHSSKGNAESNHLGLSKSAVLGESERDRHNSGSNFAQQGSGDFGTFHEGSSTQF